MKRKIVVNNSVVNRFYWYFNALCMIGIMPKALRSTTCKDIFDFDSQKDAMCNIYMNAMDPLIKCRRKRSIECERPWDAKWSTNRYEHIVKRHCAAVNYMKDKPDVVMRHDSVYPSMRSSTRRTKK